MAEGTWFASVSYSFLSAYILVKERETATLIKAMIKQSEKIFGKMYR